MTDELPASTAASVRLKHMTFFGRYAATERDRLRDAFVLFEGKATA